MSYALYIILLNGLAEVSDQRGFRDYIQSRNPALTQSDNPGFPLGTYQVLSEADGIIYCGKVTNINFIQCDDFFQS